MMDLTQGQMIEQKQERVKLLTSSCYFTTLFYMSWICVPCSCHRHRI